MDNLAASFVIPNSGDVDDLDYMTRMKLSLLLDTSEDGKDWKKLCILLGLEPLLPAFNTVSSPTRELLNYYEVFQLMMIITITLEIQCRPVVVLLVNFGHLL